VLLGNDTVRIFDSVNTTQLPLGTVDLGGSTYVGGGLGLGEATSFPSSTMSISGNVLTVTLGTPGANVTTALLVGIMQWTPFDLGHRPRRPTQ